MAQASPTLHSLKISEDEIEALAEYISQFTPLAGYIEMADDLDDIFEIKDVKSLLNEMGEELTEELREIILDKVTRTLLPTTGDSTIDDINYDFVYDIVDRTEQTMSNGASIQDVQAHFNAYKEYSHDLGTYIEETLSGALHKLRNPNRKKKTEAELRLDISYLERQYNNLREEYDRLYELDWPNDPELERQLIELMNRMEEIEYKISKIMQEIDKRFSN
jgi:hypothetical protein